VPVIFGQKIVFCLGLNFTKKEKEFMLRCEFPVLLLLLFGYREDMDLMRYFQLVNKNPHVTPKSIRAKSKFYLENMHQLRYKKGKHNKSLLIE